MAATGDGDAFRRATRLDSNSIPAIAPNPKCRIVDIPLRVRRDVRHRSPNAPSRRSVTRRGGIRPMSPNRWKASIEADMVAVARVPATSPRPAARTS